MHDPKIFTARTTVLDVDHYDAHEGTVRGLTTAIEQYIPQSLLDRIADKRFHQDQNFSSLVRHDEDIEIATIPIGLAQHWFEVDGFDVCDDDVTTAEIIARLRRDGLEGFLSTNKSF